ncbi:hypothetical protein [Saccharopolyspora sp. NPDC002376]
MAMVVSAAVTHAWHNGKSRSAARWEEAKRRAADAAANREQKKQQRAAEWDAKFDAAISKGPRHPLWWGYAAGYLAGGAITAVGAGLVGAYSGAIAGGKAGHRIGLEAGRKGRKFGDAWGDAWREWQHQRSSQAVDLAQCARCKGWITSDQLTRTNKDNRLCPDCLPGPEQWTDPADDEPEDVVHQRRPGDDLPPRCANACGLLAREGRELCAACQIEEINRLERRAARRRAERAICSKCHREFPSAERHRIEVPGWTSWACRECCQQEIESRLANKQQGQCNGRCQNSLLSPSEAMERGLCPDCGGRGDLISNFGGKHRHNTCPNCKGSGKYRSGGSAREKFVLRCSCGAPAVPGRFMCGRCFQQHQKAKAAEKQQAEQEQKGPIRVTAERIYPEKEEHPKPKEIANTMTAIEPARVNDVDSSGEGYATTVSAMESLVSLMGEVRNRLNDLNEQLTASSLDADTLSKISDLSDEIESVEDNAKSLHQHVESRHQGLAAATSEAGGSQNVATKTWYDNY